MLSLTAIHPNRRRIVNLDCIGGRVGRCIGGRHESTEEASNSGIVHRDRLAWLIEGRLGDGVVRGRKLKLYHIADGSHDVVGGESERSGGRATNANDVYGDTACCCWEGSQLLRQEKGEQRNVPKALPMLKAADRARVENCILKLFDSTSRIKFSSF